MVGVSGLTGSWVINARSTARLEMTPARPGAYLYHSGVVAASNLQAGSYSAQAGVLLVDAPGRGVPQATVVVKESGSFIRRTRRGCEIGCEPATVNGRLAAAAAGPGVGAGGRVLVHALNASATETYSLAPGSRWFEVVALDGHPVRPVGVSEMRLSPGETVSAWVDANQSLTWQVTPATDNAPDYSVFRSGRTPGYSLAGPGNAPGHSNGAGSAPAAIATARVVLARHAAARSGLNRWSVNGGDYVAAGALSAEGPARGGLTVGATRAMPTPALRLAAGRRHSLQIQNTTDELIPLRLADQPMRVTRLADGTAASLLKDVVGVGPHQQIEVDVTSPAPDPRGTPPAPGLLYSTRQWQRDFGLMAGIEWT